MWLTICFPGFAFWLLRYSFNQVVNKCFIFSISLCPIWGWKNFLVFPFLCFICFISVPFPYLLFEASSSWWQVHSSWHFPLSLSPVPSHSMRQLQLWRETLDLSEAGMILTSDRLALVKKSNCWLQQLTGHGGRHEVCGDWQAGRQCPENEKTRV